MIPALRRLRCLIPSVITLIFLAGTLLWIQISSMPLVPLERSNLSSIVHFSTSTRPSSASSLTLPARANQTASHSAVSPSQPSTRPEASASPMNKPPAKVVHEERARAVAILVMAPADLMPWARAFGAMRSRIDAFMFLWRDAPSAIALDEAYNISKGTLTAVIHEKNTSWSTGRNILARAAYAAEVNRGLQYQYWFFLDEELLWCKGCERAPSQVSSATACCLDYAVQDVLLGPYNFAMIGVHHMASMENPEPFTESQARSFNINDCPDAKFAAIHRDAAPILLPYASDFDAVKGWWASQLLLYHFSSACIPGASAIMSRVFRDVSTAHAKYPRWPVKPSVISSYLSTHLPALASGGFLINRTDNPVVCNRHGGNYFPGRDTVFSAWDTSESKALTRARWMSEGLPVANWTGFAPYQTCLKELLPRFEADIGLGVQPAPPYNTAASFSGMSMGSPSWSSRSGLHNNKNAAVPSLSLNSSQHMKRFALGIQCDFSWLKKWYALWGKFGSDIHTDTSLFVYAYGRVEEALPIERFLAQWAAQASSPLVSWIAPSTHTQTYFLRRNTTNDTWTSGRNTLARAIRAAEVARGYPFGWWAFADGDMSVLSCDGCASLRGASLSACCFNHVYKAAILLPFASVGAEMKMRSKIRPKSIKTSPDLYIVGPLVDAQLHVMHRNAVPVLLPYHEELDDRSWWASQAILQRYLATCFPPGSSVVSGMNVVGAESHVGYPRGRYTEQDIQIILRKAFPAIATIAYGPPEHGAVPKPLARNMSYWRRFVGPSDVPAWQMSAIFKSCIKAREPYFLSYFHTN